MPTTAADLAVSRRATDVGPTLDVGSVTGDEAQPTKPRMRRLAPSKGTIWIFLVQVAIVGAGLLAWERSSGRPGDPGVLLDEFYVGKPSKAIDALRQWASDGTLYEASFVTLKETLIGFALGCSAGLFVGFVLGVSRTLARIFNPFIVAANTIPKLALAPLFLLWFGLGSGSKIALAAVLVFFLVFVNTYSGVRDVDEDLVNVLRMMGANRLTIHGRVTLPSAMVWVIAGLRVSVPYAFLGSVVGQMLAAQRGLGVLIQRSASNFNPSAMFAAIFVLVVFALALNLVVSAVERRLLRWKSVR